MENNVWQPQAATKTQTTNEQKRNKEKARHVALLLAGSAPRLFILFIVSTLAQVVTEK